MALRASIRAPPAWGFCYIMATARRSHRPVDAPSGEGVPGQAPSGQGPRTGSYGVPRGRLDAQGGYEGDLPLLRLLVLHERQATELMQDLKVLKHRVVRRTVWERLVQEGEPWM